MISNIMSVKAFRTVLILLALLASKTASANLPQGEYACEVQTQAGVAGLVMVQTDSLAEAERAAAQASAHKLGGGKSPAISVIECIVVGEGRFREAYFQDFYEKFPK